MVGKLPQCKQRSYVLCYKFELILFAQVLNAGSFPDVLLVVAHYNENLQWLQKQERYPCIIYTKSRAYHATENSTSRLISPEINAGSEAQAYLQLGFGFSQNPFV
jgi:hypothetical protein